VPRASPGKEVVVFVFESESGTMAIVTGVVFVFVSVAQLVAEHSAAP
jgi:hypothetical protein